MRDDDFTYFFSSLSCSHFHFALSFVQTHFTRSWLSQSGKLSHLSEHPMNIGSRLYIAGLFRLQAAESRLGPALATCKRPESTATAPPAIALFSGNSSRLEHKQKQINHARSSAK
jgi:hypothetical protein